jgi:Rnl2 family RNA ligase
MKFEKYHKIVRSTKNLGRLDLSGEWVATEKYDGANFSIWIDKDNNLRPAKRNSFLEETEKFYHFQVAYNTELKQKCISLREELKDYNTIIIYFELYGGGCAKHEDPKYTKYKAVQKRIHYSKDIKLIAYDIGYKNNDTDDIKYFGYVRSQDLLKRHNISHVDILTQGTFDDCLEYLYDKRECEYEGLVIKPADERSKRVCIKRVNEDFNEMAGVRPVQKVKYMPSEVTKRICEMANENRVYSAISKFGEIEMRNHQDIAKMVYEDIKEDLEGDEKDGDLSRLWFAVNKITAKTMKKYIASN